MVEQATPTSTSSPAIATTRPENGPVTRARKQLNMDSRPALRRLRLRALRCLSSRDLESFSVGSLDSEMEQKDPLQGGLVSGEVRNDTKLHK